MNEKEISFEEALEKLQNAVNKLESGEIKLDEAFSLFEEGIKYVKICEAKLTKSSLLKEDNFSANSSSA